jgi:hypothetical protein
VHQALYELGAQGVTVTEVQGVGRQLGHPELFHGNPYVADFLPKVMIEVILQDDKLDEAILAIQKKARRPAVSAMERYFLSPSNRRSASEPVISAPALSNPHPKKSKRAAGTSAAAWALDVRSKAPA